jgi:hypothetical protein
MLEDRQLARETDNLPEEGLNRLPQSGRRSHHRIGACCADQRANASPRRQDTMELNAWNAQACPSPQKGIFFDSYIIT